MQESTWGTGREPDYHPNKKKQEMITPGPAHYNHVYTNDNFLREQRDGYSFPLAQRDIQKRRNSDKEPPGPGNYDPKLPPSGTAKSILGGAEKKEDKHNGVPSPGKHSPKYPIETPAWSMGKPPAEKRNKDD